MLVGDEYIMKLCRFGLASLLWRDNVEIKMTQNESGLDLLPGFT